MLVGDALFFKSDKDLVAQIGQPEVSSNLKLCIIN